MIVSLTHPHKQKKIVIIYCFWRSEQSKIRRNPGKIHLEINQEVNDRHNLLIILHLEIKGVSSWCNDYSDGLRIRSTRARALVALLRSLSGKYPWERYESPYPPSYGLNSITTVLLGEWLRH